MRRHAKRLEFLTAPDALEHLPAETVQPRRHDHTRAALRPQLPHTREESLVTRPIVARALQHVLLFGLDPPPLPRTVPPARHELRRQAQPLTRLLIRRDAGVDECLWVLFAPRG